jgi:hypothetical protein
MRVCVAPFRGRAEHIASIPSGQVAHRCVPGRDTHGDRSSLARPSGVRISPSELLSFCFLLIGKDSHARGSRDGSSPSVSSVRLEYSATSPYLQTDRLRFQRCRAVRIRSNIRPRARRFFSIFSARSRSCPTCFWTRSSSGRSTSSQGNQQRASGHRSARFAAFGPSFLSLPVSRPEDAPPDYLVNPKSAHP